MKKKFESLTAHQIQVKQFKHMSRFKDETAMVQSNNSRYRQCHCALVKCYLFAFIGFIVSTQTGCQIFRKFGSPKQPIPIEFNQLPSQAELVNRLNARADSIYQLSSNVSVDMAGAPKIKGTLRVEFPDRMRLKAGVIVEEMGVDVGSNEQQFWIWMRVPLPNQPPAFYFANHAAYQQSQIRKSIPLDPKWLIEGLGLIRIEPTDASYGPKMAEGGRMRFYSVRQTVSGPQTRVMLLDAATGLIQQQALYDAQNQLIAYTNSSEYRVIQRTDGSPLSLPGRIELHMLQGNQDTEMVIRLSSVSLEKLYGNAQKMWSMPNPDGVQKIDLTQVSNRPPAVGGMRPQPGGQRTPAYGAGFSRN